MAHILLCDQGICLLLVCVQAVGCVHVCAYVCVCVCVWPCLKIVLYVFICSEFQCFAFCLDVFPLVPMSCLFIKASSHLNIPP